MLGSVLGFGCSSTDNDASGKPTASAAVAAAGEAGAGGSGNGSRAAADDEAGAGGACAGNYACPEVAYGWYASITVDLPLSVADAAGATFTACRNGECYSAKGNAQAEPGPGSPWQEGANETALFLMLGDSGATPSAALKWDFFPNTAVIVSDQYSLTVQAVGASQPTTLFDQRVTYGTEVSDPSLVSEGYCRHCSEIEAANVDARASK